MEILHRSNSADDEFLNNKEIFLNQLLESIDEYAIFTTDKNGTLTSWNKGAENLFLYTEDEALGRNVNILYTPQDIAAEAPEKEMREALEKGRGVNERYHVRKDRSRFWGSGLVFPLFDTNREFQGFTKLMRNLTWVKETQEESLQIKEIFRTTIEASPTPIYVVVGQDMIITLANPATLKAWGKDSSVVGKKFSEALPELADQPFLQLKRKVFASGTPHHSEGEQVDFVVDGKLQTFYFKFTYQPLWNSEGRIYGLLCTATEVTELINAKKQVEHSQNTLVKMIAQAPVAMCILSGPQYIIEVANKKMFELWGISQEYLKKPMFEALPSVRGDFEPLLNQVYYEDKTLEFEEMSTELFKNGIWQTLFLNFTYQPLKEFGASTSAVLAVAVDVTAQVISRKKIEEAEHKTQALNEKLTGTNEELSSINDRLIEANNRIRESEERFKLAVENTEAGVFDTNLITGKTVRSLRHAQIYGYQDLEEEWTVDKMQSHIYPPDFYSAQQVYLDSLISGNLNSEVRIVRVDGAIRWINIVGKISYDQNNKPVRIIGTVVDITARKELQRQKDEFISTVSHELKTPITSIIAYTQFIQRSLASEGNTKNINFLNRMDVQINSLESLIKDLLDTTRVEFGRLGLNLEEVEMNTLVAELTSDLQLITPSHRLIITHNTPVRIKVDRERIIQVITNFITNAVKYSPQAKRVNVGLTLADSEIVFSVQDFGKGIPKEHYRYIFERFHQVSDSDMNLGLGLGLYISKEIVTRHGGKIWFESTVDIGSTFYFSLPYSS